MKLVHALWRIILTMAMSGLAWLVWQSPQPAVQPPTVQVSLPPLNGAGRNTTDSPAPKGHGEVLIADHHQLWRVVTHRVMSKEGIRALEKRLVGMHLQPVPIHTTEDMTMHAFDDAELFQTSRKAHLAAAFWQQHDIETTVMKAAEGVYLLGLGRYYQAKYAEISQKQLDRVGRPYRYQQRRVPIPVVRFTFPAGDKQQAEVLWKKLNVTGVVMPVLISERQFDKLYANNIPNDAKKAIP